MNVANLASYNRFRSYAVAVESYLVRTYDVKNCISSIDSRQRGYFAVKRLLCTIMVDLRYHYCLFIQSLTKLYLRISDAMTQSLVIIIIF